MAGNAEQHGYSPTVSPFDVELRADCYRCGHALLSVMSRCPKCHELREELVGLDTLEIPSEGGCVFSGRATSMRLPNGDFIFPAYLRAFCDAGWLDDEFSYTEAFFSANPSARRVFEETARLLPRKPCREVYVPADGTLERTWAVDLERNVFRLLPPERIEQPTTSTPLGGAGWKFPPLTLVECEVLIQDGLPRHIVRRAIEDPWFFDAIGHVSKGTKARYIRLFENVAQNAANQVDPIATGMHGPEFEGVFECYLWTAKSGKQVYVVMRDGKLEQAGISPADRGGWYEGIPPR